ncbi:MAG: hypothetical protein ACK587_05040 [Cyanobacteriota bacterium]
MEFRARLVHVDPQRRVVQVRAFEGERCLGSALGEATNAEEAEDRAQDRLRQRLRIPLGEPVSPSSSRASVAAPPAALATAPQTARAPAPDPFAAPPPNPSAAPDPAPPASPSSAQPATPPAAAPAPPLTAPPSTPPPSSPAPTRSEPVSPSLEPPGSGPVVPGEPPEPPVDPEDWSADLARLDRLLATLGWGREQERIYVRRLFGQASRSRLTRYADLMVLQRALEALPPGSPPDTAPLPLLRVDLLAQCDDLLARLGWPTDRARQCLEARFGVNSRQSLSDDQLLAFNLLLEGELLESAGLEGADGCLELPADQTRPSPP